MKNLCFNIAIGLSIGTFFSTETVSHLMSDRAFASIPVVNITRIPATFAPATNNQIVQFKDQTFDKGLILNDYEKKISPEFRVTEDLRKRVSFWFDIYTKYSAQEQVIHHADFPWVVFRVVDLRPILEAEGNKWVKYHKSEKYAKAQRQDVKNILRKLSNRKNYLKLSGDEQVIFDQLEKIPGKNRRKVILTALHSLRTQVGQKDFIEKGLESSSQYIPELERVFAEQNLPLELTRLPFVESSFNVNAVSKVGASGIWQVMPYIGRKLLIMNGAVDERNSPVKSASSAAFILKQNKQILKTWPLALTAYNHGVGSLNTAVKKTQSRDLNYLIKHYNTKSFGFASQNFYCSFLAILHAEKYRAQIYDKVTPLAPLEFNELKLTKSVKIKTLLKFTGMSAEGFQKYNLDIKKDAFKKNMLVPKGYVVHIPTTIVTEFLSKNQKFGTLINLGSASAL